MSTTTAIKWLERIANPIKYLQEEAEKDGSKLDGAMAIQLSKDANWLQSLAEQAIKEIQSTTKDGIKSANEKLYEYGINTMNMEDHFNSQLFAAMHDYAIQFNLQTNKNKSCQIKM